MRRRPFLLGLLVLLGSSLVAGAAVPAGAGSKPPQVPEGIAVPAGQKVVLDVVGKGVQIYDCKPGATDRACSPGPSGSRRPCSTAAATARSGSTSAAPPSSPSTAAA